MHKHKGYSKEDIRLFCQQKWWLGLTIGDVLGRSADIYKDKEALIDDYSRYSYSELNQLVDIMSYQLLRRGLRPGDAVLLQLPNWAEFVISYFAIQKAGLIMVLLTVNHSDKEISHLAKLTKPKAWIVPEKHRKQNYLKIIEQVVAENTEIKDVFIVRSQGKHPYTNLEDILHIEKDLKAVRTTLNISKPDSLSICQILPSGGTTGLPKGAIRTHNDYVCNIEFTSKSWQISPDDTCLVASTVGHNLALLIGITGPIYHGAKIVMLDSSYPKDFCDIVQNERVTCTAIVPTLISRIVNYEKIEDYDLTSLKKIYVGAANSPPELVKLVESKFKNCVYINGFGMVEGPLSQSRIEDTFEIRSKTIGRQCCPYDKFVTIDDMRQPTPVNVEGELVVKGPGIFSGYLFNPGANEKAFTEDGFFRTGDLAVVDEQGNIRITGRIKDVINRGGENIASRDVEDIISTIQNVEYVAVVGIPDPDLGEAICAFIKPTEGNKISAEFILKKLRSMSIAKKFTPSHIEIVREIPLTAAGKADKMILKQMIKSLL